MRRQDALTCRPTPMWRKALAWITSLAMVLMFVPAVAIPLPAWADDAAPSSDGVMYLDADGHEQICTNYVEVKSDDTDWGTGGQASWYVANDQITIDQRVNANGDVHLILADGCSLTINGGINVNGGDSNLTIYAQSDDENVGVLQANGSEFAAGIGSSKSGQSGVITISGGAIEANGGRSGSGIGCGWNGQCKEINIIGGKVNAISGWYAPAIGNGNSGTLGNITITSGNVVASSQTQQGSTQGPAIGACAGICGKVLISGGKVNAQGGRGPGIGNNSEDKGIVGEIVISYGAVVSANSIKQENRNAWNGIVFEDASGKIYGSVVTSSTSFEIDAGKVLTLEPGRKLVVPPGQMLTNNGAITNQGIVEIDGGFANNGSVVNDGEFSCGGTISGVNTSTVSFVANGGAINGSHQESYIHGVGMILPTQVIKNGYDFKGWCEDDSDVGNTIASISKTDTGAKTFYAKWAPVSYTVEFDANGGKGAMDSQTFTYDEAQALALSAFSKTGYSFAGWKVQGDSAGAVIGDGQSVKNLTAASNGVVTLVAQWKANSYTISFDSAGGTDVGSITQNYGTTVSAPADPAREGYTFGGWFRDGESQAYAFATMPAEDVALKARWVLNSYTISFDSAGGTAVDSITKDYGQNITAPANPTRVGYVFAGWSDKIPATMPAKDVTLTAQWTPVSYTVEFDANGGEGKMDSQAFTYDVAKRLAANSFTKSGYYLSGWKDIATGKTYGNEQEVMNLAAKQDAVVKLQAQWSIPYTPSPAPDPKPDPKPDPTPEPGTPGTEVSGTDDSGNKVSGTVIGNDEVRLPSGGKADGSIEFTGTTGSGGSGGSGSGSDGSGGSTPSEPGSGSGSGGSEPSTPIVSVKVPETVTVGDKAYAVVKVADNAFAGQKELTEVTLPETIAEIGKNAFENTGITAIELPGSVSAIGDNAFANTPLETIVIPKSVASIGKNAFKGCEKLKDVGLAESSVTEIANSAFAGTGIESVELPATAKTIGTGAFENCKDLVSAETNAIKIGTRAFAACENLKKVTSKAKTIGGEAFRGCSSLVKVDISKAAQIGDKAFSGCKGLKKATLGTGLKTIGKEAFKGCNDLKSLTITSKQLSKKQIAQCLKGSKVEQILVQVGTKKQNQKYAEKYAKFFTKKIAGKKVSVKAAKKPLKK